MFGNKSRILRICTCISLNEEIIGMKNMLAMNHSSLLSVGKLESPQSIVLFCKNIWYVFSMTKKLGCFSVVVTAIRCDGMCWVIVALSFYDSVDMWMFSPLSSLLSHSVSLLILLFSFSTPLPPCPLPFLFQSLWLLQTRNSITHWVQGWHTLIPKNNNSKIQKT